jgi:hypothetical protein
VFEIIFPALRGSVEPPAYETFIRLPKRNVALTSNGFTSKLFRINVNKLVKVILLSF